MEAYKERMIDEYTELVDRIAKLDKFIDKVDMGEVTVSDTQYNLLKTQCYAMCAYSGTLLLRMRDLKISYPTS